MSEIAMPSLESIASSMKSAHSTMEDMVLNAMREAILFGVFPPGERLPQDKIADTLGVSRIPVRASLRQLESEGLVELRPYRGAIVRLFSPEEVSEIYELRILLESDLLTRVIACMSDEEIGDIADLADAMDSEEDPTVWMDKRQAFYSHLYQFAERPRTLDIVTNLRSVLGSHWMSIKFDRSDGHHVLVDYVRQRDRDEAVKWLEDHLTDVSNELQLRIREGYFGKPPK